MVSTGKREREGPRWMPGRGGVRCVEVSWSDGAYRVHSVVMKRSLEKSGLTTQPEIQISS